MQNNQAVFLSHLTRYMNNYSFCIFTRQKRYVERLLAYYGHPDKRPAVQSTWRLLQWLHGFSMWWMTVWKKEERPRALSEKQVSSVDSLVLLVFLKRNDLKM